MSTTEPMKSEACDPLARSLEGRRAVVCGSTRGIGRACAETLARLGAEITLMARSPAGLDEVSGELATDHGQRHGSICVDFDDWQTVREAITTHVARHAPIHILVNNSGGPPGGAAHEAEPEAYLAAFQRHLVCSQVLVQALLPGMRESGYGRIVNIISTSVITPIKGLGVSNTVRGAVGNWARTLASELGGTGITVNSILPGFTDTARLEQIFMAKAERTGHPVDAIRQTAIDTIPTGRLGHAGEIAAAVAFLASPAASYVNGVNLPVDGGRLAAQ